MGTLHVLKSCPALLLLALLILSTITSQAANSPNAGCPGCARPRPHDSIRLEAIKLQILTKLGLKSRPQVKRALPRELVLASLSRASEQSTPASGPSTKNYSPWGSEESFDQDFDSTTTADELDYDDFYGRTSEIITFAEPGIN